MPPPVSKKRKLAQADRPEEISFDPAARQEYLTGFHKRKQQRIQNAKEAAIKREKEERIRDRKQLRDQRKVELEKHVAEVNAELRKQKPDLEHEEEVEDEWQGIENEDPEKNALDDIAQDEEYVDEDKYTTVTVEAMEDDDEDEEEDRRRAAAAANGELNGNAGRKPNGKSKLANGKPKPKKKKFRYESKAERNADRQKLRAKNRAAKEKRTAKS